MLFWRRTLALLMTVAILVCGMTACTGDGGDNPATEAPVQTEATTKREPTQTKPETSVTDVVMVKNADSKAITTEICSDLRDYLV